MTEEWIPRGETNWEKLMPNGAGAKDLYNRIKKILEYNGVPEKYSAGIALQIWQETRKR